MLHEGSNIAALLFDKLWVDENMERTTLIDWAKGGEKGREGRERGEKKYGGMKWGVGEKIKSRGGSNMRLGEGGKKE